MTPERTGQIITFYSYKGGTGRTMALANTACVLAAREAEAGGKGVLMIDWDLEAPGLHRYFRSQQRGLRARVSSSEAEERMQPGLIDLFSELDRSLDKVHDAADETLSTGERKSALRRSETLARDVLNAVSLQEYIVPTMVQKLNLLTAGRTDPLTPNAYSERVNTFDWEKLYLKSPHLIRVFAETLAERYTYVLIDSRTGVTDISGICTMLLPEKLVAVFTPNVQSIEGALNLIRQATEYRKESAHLRPLLVFPLVSRVDATISDLRERWRYGSSKHEIVGYQSQFEKLLADIYDKVEVDLNHYFDEIQIQHSPPYAYGEEIAALIEKAEDRFSLKRSYQTFADHLVSARTPWLLDAQDPRPPVAMKRVSAPEVSRSAIDLIGKGAPDDYTIKPSQHAQQYEKTAPELANLLRSSDVETTAKQYERLDGEAMAAQQHFKRLSNRANLTVLITAILAALTLATGAAAMLLEDRVTQVLLLGLSLGTLVAGALASKDLLSIRQGHLLEKWMSTRALAETARLEYFERVTSAAPYVARSTQLKSFIPVPLVQFEYFRRYQFDVQYAYYGARRKDHQRSADKTLSLSGWAVAAGAITTGLAGVLGVFVHPGFVAVGAIGAAFTGLASFAATREAINQDRRNAERYDRTYHVLEDLSKRLDDVRTAVLAAGAAPLGSFVDAVHEQLSLEHRQWLGELGEARGAFARLEDTLKKLTLEFPMKA